MLPTKKVQLNFPNMEQPDTNFKVEDKLDDDDDYDSDHNDRPNKKQRKRRTLSETSKRDFICGCGRSYVSYPAIYLHVQRKHNCEWPDGTVIPEKANDQDKVKRGRPKKDKNAATEVEADFQLEDKSKAEDNFWVFMGTKGNPNNPKAENKFITNLETDSFDPFKVFVPQELFENDVIYNDVLQTLRAIMNISDETQTTMSNGSTQKIEAKNAKSYDHRLSHFLLWISTPLREDIFVEIAILLCLLRTAILSSIWSTSQENLISFKGENLEIKMVPWTLLVKTTKADAEQVQSFLESKVCPLFGPQWSEIRKSSGGKILSRILSTVVADKNSENLFFERVSVLSDIDSGTLTKMAEAVLNLKDSEIKEAARPKKKFHFLNWNTIHELKELIQKICDWLQYYKEDEFNLQDTDLYLNQ